MCFVCGIENPMGLKLKFYTDDKGRCIGRFQPPPEHQGYPGQLHGGLISTLLDETMGRVLTAFGRLPAL
jgi:acyl-coenzyme A thioesterase PaaI-like protein